jgi:hypothetical protein
MRRRSEALAAVLLLASACANQQEEAARKESAPAAEQDFEAPSEEARFAPELPSPADDAAPRSLADIERERAANNAKLRQLGVALPGDHPVESAAPSAETKPKKTTSKSTSGTPLPGGQPSKADRNSSPKPAKPSEKAKDEGKGGGDMIGDGVRPDAAKSTPLSPSGGLDATARCEQVCDLAAISCGLGDQICELAERHEDDPTYAAACERAHADCDAAKDACDACAE